MKKVLAVLIVFVAFSLSLAQSEGGIINKNKRGVDSLTPWNADQAIASITHPFTSKVADSASCTISAKYGSNLRLAQIRNISATMQRIKVSFLSTGDTSTYTINAYSESGRIPFIKRVISGALADSTAYDFLYKN